MFSVGASLGATTAYADRCSGRVARWERLLRRLPGLYLRSGSGGTETTKGCVVGLLYMEIMHR